MDKQFADKFLELFTASSGWVQSSNANFTEFLISENKYLKTELESYKKASQKREQDLINELAILRQNVEATTNHNEMRHHITNSETSFSSLNSRSNAVVYQPRQKDSLIRSKSRISSEEYQPMPVASLGLDTTSSAVVYQPTPIATLSSLNSSQNGLFTAAPTVSLPNSSSALNDQPPRAESNSQSSRNGLFTALHLLNLPNSNSALNDQPPRVESNSQSSQNDLFTAAPTVSLPNSSSALNDQPPRVESNSQSSQNGYETPTINLNTSSVLNHPAPTCLSNYIAISNNVGHTSSTLKTSTPNQLTPATEDSIFISENLEFVPTPVNQFRRKKACSTVAPRQKTKKAKTPTIYDDSYFIDISSSNE